MTEAKIPEQQIGEPLPEKNQSSWLKFMTFALIASALISAVVWLIAVKAPNDDNLPDSNSVDVENQE